MLGISPKFNEALASVAGALAFKIGVLNLMTVRSRFISGDMKTGRVKAWEEDERTPEWLRKVFKLTLGAAGPTFATEVCQSRLRLADAHSSLASSPSRYPTAAR